MPHPREIPNGTSETRVTDADESPFWDRYTLSETIFYVSPKKKGALVMKFIADFAAQSIGQ